MNLLTIEAGDRFYRITSTRDQLHRQCSVLEEYQRPGGWTEMVSLREKDATKDEHVRYLLDRLRRVFGAEVDRIAFTSAVGPIVGPMNARSKLIERYGIEETTPLDVADVEFIEENKVEAES